MTNRITDVHPVDKPVMDLNSQNILRVEVSYATNINFSSAPKDSMTKLVNGVHLLLCCFSYLK